ncbi:zinc finger FYVE domain-containing protein 1-like isoform X2 [Dermacentor albipictus]|uniref:zinc finger FYVE domain-containing protein 1-like isoform X2 n=1 Tax=Dermacentor albipictus TaxID=60249 RepID=UPI0038FC804A
MIQLAAASHSQSSQGCSVPHPATRCAKPTCAERLTCKGPHPSALYFCLDCDTNQCEGCELVLHQESRFRDHRPRVPVAEPDPQLLCLGFSCQGENLADIRCHTCQRSLCYACDYQIHLLRRKFAHVKVRFRYYLERQAKLAAAEVEVDDEEEQYLSAEPDCSSSYEDSSTNMMSLQSLIEPDIVSGTHSGCKAQPMPASILLVDDKEVLQVSSAADLAAQLGCGPETLVKVVSIFGNTGEGKSHTLNHSFYNGQRVFQTSPQQESCTIGVWAAHCPEHGLLTIDTEGLLGVAENQNQRTRLLLKVLAVSDIVIYRTRAERLTTDLFTFLGDASQAYVGHFTRELKTLKDRCNLSGPISALGPAVIVFHETMHTRPLVGSEDSHSPVEELKKRFGLSNQSFDAFSDLQYVGIQTVRLPTCFDGLRAAVKKVMDNSTVRSARPVEVIFQALKVTSVSLLFPSRMHHDDASCTALLNDKFSGDIEKTVASPFPDQYFTCPIVCIACAARCIKTMNHQDTHSCDANCQYQYQLDNRVHQCKDCYEKSGRKVILTPQTAAKNDSAVTALVKFAWSGYVLECPSCGVIYQSRQYWYGNRNPDETVTRVEIVHVWPGDKSAQEPSITAQRVLDGLQTITETVATYSARPTRTMSDWINDQIAPSYWVPNYKIQACHKCKSKFPPEEKKHHCRACGNGFCEGCSSKKRPVPERGWGTEPVRVCDSCFDKESDQAATASPEEGSESELTARKVGEAIRSTFGAVASAMEYPLGLIKDTARPTYWEPDHELTKCAICSEKFGPRNTIHHCRSCGRGVCNDCSMARRPVISRGWESAVRVCKECDERLEL